MKLVADFHIHSKYSRATSKDMNLEVLDKWAKIKGINILGTGDFTHPEWFRNLEKLLEPAEPGLFRLKNSDTRFILTSEISCIYTEKNKVRKIHLLVFAPSLEVVGKINARLDQIGNIKSDGRPILGISAKEVLKISLETSPECVVIPAHAWTPWFSIFGSKSGFNSIEECFDEYSKNIFAIETGLSSDPAMNWRLSSLDKISLISNSDSHGPSRLGREANVFELKDLSYKSIVEAIREKDPQKFLYTIEFFPEEGKYHYDGHRICGVSFSPEESKKYNNLCPVCAKPLIIGVLNRVEELADREIGFIPENIIPYKSLIPLEEIIAESLGVGTASKRVKAEYNKLIKLLGNEFHILIDALPQELEPSTDRDIAAGIIKAREGKVSVIPGYDGVYGKVKVFGEGQKTAAICQKTLF